MNSHHCWTLSFFFNKSSFRLNRENWAIYEPCSKFDPINLSTFWANDQKDDINVKKFSEQVTSVLVHFLKIQKKYSGISFWLFPLIFVNLKKIRPFREDSYEKKNFIVEIFLLLG